MINHKGRVCSLSNISQAKIDDHKGRGVDRTIDTPNDKIIQLGMGPLPNLSIYNKSLSSC